jgi:ABC-type amino acid transport substrate-binding protein
MTMHRCLAWGLALALVAASAPGADLEDIQKRGVLRAIAQEGEAPEMFRFSGAGEPGFEKEMLQGFAALYDLRLVAVPVGTSAERIPALLRGDGDVIVGVVDTASRRRQIAFTPEVLPARHLVVTCAPDASVGSVEEFRERKVGVVDGTSWKDEAVAAGVPVEKMTLFPTREPVFEALESGRITATVMTMTDFLLAARSHPCLEGGAGLGSPGSAGWGVRKESTDLQAALEAYIFNYRAGPSWNRLIVKYFGDQALRALGRK